MLSVPIHQAKGQLSELIRAAEQGEQVVLTRHGKPVVRLVAEVADVDQAERDRVAAQALTELRAFRAAWSAGMGIVGWQAATNFAGCQFGPCSIWRERQPNNSLKRTVQSLRDWSCRLAPAVWTAPCQGKVGSSLCRSWFFSCKLLLNFADVANGMDCGSVFGLLASPRVCMHGCRP